MRPKQETSCCAGRSDIGRWRSHTLRNLYRATVTGRGRDWLLAHVWLAVHRTIMGLCCVEYVKLHRRAYNMFYTDTVPSNGLI